VAKLTAMGCAGVSSSFGAALEAAAPADSPEGVKGLGKDTPLVAAQGRGGGVIKFVADDCKFEVGESMSNDGSFATWSAMPILR
jgi:hypothetical protein